MSKSEEGSLLLKREEKKKCQKKDWTNFCQYIFSLGNFIFVLCSMLQERDDYALELAMGDE